MWVVEKAALKAGKLAGLMGEYLAAVMVDMRVGNLAGAKVC